ncbi:hypothetical protein BC940DRAFT_291181 [Gongronella butleri]|nr:hypothetical protein BC940DRAFT_291181 [Gongronella butleri]
MTMLYEQTKRDVFYPGGAVHLGGGPRDGHSNDDGPSPSVTTIVLLQVQASMIQAISHLHKTKSQIPQVVQTPLRWGLLFGLVVVDNVARALHVEQEMNNVCPDHSTVSSDDHAESPILSTSSSSVTIDTKVVQSPLYQRATNQQPHLVSSLNDSADSTRVSLHTPPKQSSSTSLLPAHRSQSMTSSPMAPPAVIMPQRSQSTSFLGSYKDAATPLTSPLLAIQPPLVSHSAQGLRVRLRKTSSPPAFHNRLAQPSRTPPAAYARTRSVSNQLHDHANNTNNTTKFLKRQPSTVRRVTARRNLADDQTPASSSSHVSPSSNADALLSH